MDSINVQYEAWKIIAAETNDLDEDYIPCELIGVYGDIRVELFKKSPDSAHLIDEYTELMAREQKLYSPEEAYQAGHEDATEKQSFLPFEYIKRVFLEPNNQRFLSERDNLYHELCCLLGETHGLMDEFNELYRSCNGIIGRKIDSFYYMGYYKKTPKDEIA